MLDTTVNKDIEAAREVRCIGFQQLKEWQVQQFRKAVDVHRMEMSQELGHCVSWSDAEIDFCAKDCSEKAEKWRYEYCGLMCPYRRYCLLALQFIGDKLPDGASLHQVS